MKKVIHILSIMTITGGCILLSGNAFAEAKDHHRREEWREKRQQKRQQMYERLGVTDEQKRRLAEHRKQHKNSSGQYKDQIRTKKQQLNEALKSGDTAQARQIHAEIKSMKSDIQDKRLEGVLGVREILTDEQFSEFMEVKEERRENRKEKKGSGK